jgi:hypothetical protein
MARQLEPGKEAPALTVSPEKVCFLIVKVRELDAKDVAAEGDDSSNASDDQMIGVLENRGMMRFCTSSSRLLRA